MEQWGSVIKAHQQQVQLAQRAMILNLEKALQALPHAKHGDCYPMKHSFAPGVYVREIAIPKNAILTGKIHRHAHPNFLLKGEVLVVTEFGPCEHLIAPQSMISQAGTKRAVVTLTDTVWITVHHNPDNLTDLEELEALIISPTYEEL